MSGDDVIKKWVIGGGKVCGTEGTWSQTFIKKT